MRLEWGVVGGLGGSWWGGVAGRFVACSQTDACIRDAAAGSRASDGGQMAEGVSANALTPSAEAEERVGYGSWSKRRRKRSSIRDE